MIWHSTKRYVALNIFSRIILYHTVKKQNMTMDQKI